MADLKFMTYNCRGLGSQEKRRDVINFLKNLDFDIYFIQDTHLTRKTAQCFNTVWGGNCYHSFGTNNSRGVSIIFKTRVQHSILHEEYCTEGNFVILECTIFLNTYILAAIYGPNDDRPAFFHTLCNKLEELPTNNLIIAGDFNFVADLQRDSNYVRQNNPAAKFAFSNIIERFSLIDSWREMNPLSSGYTWAKKNPFKYGRLDRIYIQNHLISTIVSANIHAGYRSDHNIVSLNVKEPHMKRGPGLWKFNAALLEDQEYNELIRKLTINIVKQYALPIYNNEYISDPINFDNIQFTVTCGLFYETLLMMIRGETVRFSKQKARKNRREENIIINEIDELNTRFNTNETEENLKRLEEKKLKLEQMRLSKIQGLITRCRVNWFEEGEKCSKYFLSLEKRNAMRNSILVIQDGDKQITNNKDILEHLSKHLQTKYRRNINTHNIKEYLEKTSSECYLMNKGLF